VFAYEPDPMLHRLLTQNLQMNGVRPLVTLLQRELTSRETPGSGQAMSARSVGRDDEGAVSDTIDDLLLERLDLIKVNDRGDPRRALDGGEATIWRLRPLLFIEQPAAGLPLGALVERVKGFSYRCWQVVTPLFSEANYNGRSEDIFQGEVARALVAAPEETEPHAALRGREEL
jgi:hypothetical protein